MTKPPFWKWLAKGLTDNFKEAMELGLWTIFPMIAHGYILYITKTEYLNPTTILWMIPMLLTALYKIWKDKP